MQDEAGTPLTTDRPASSAATPGTDRSASRPSSARSSLGAALACALLVLVLDQGSKAWALTALDERARPLLGDLIMLRLTPTPGAPAPRGAGATRRRPRSAAAIPAARVGGLRRTTDRSQAVGLGAVLGGALGNLLDRLFRAPGPGRGHVVDFLDYGGLFVGNLADIAIVLAGAYVAWRWQAADETTATGDRHG